LEKPNYFTGSVSKDRGPHKGGSAKRGRGKGCPSFLGSAV